VAEYLVVRNVRVRAANALTSMQVVGGAPLSAAHLFGHALALRAQVPEQMAGVVLVHHDRELLADRGAFNKLLPQQRRGASFTYSKNRLDYSSKSQGRPDLSLQVTASMHLEVSLVFKFLDEAPSVNMVSEFFASARFAGGVIERFDTPAIVGNCEDALLHIRRGFVVTDRSDLAREGAGGVLTPDALAEQLMAGNHTWLSVACVGYAAITDIVHRPGARGPRLGDSDRDQLADGYPHA